MRVWQTVTVALAPSSSAEQRPADEDRAADDHRLLALRVDPRRWRAAPSPPGACTGTRPGSPRASRPALVGGEPVDVLGRDRAPRSRVLVDAVGKRQLDQDPVDLVVAVELADQLEQLLLGDRAVRPWWIERIPTSSAGLVLAAHVDRGGGVVADQHGGEPGRAAELRGELLDLAARPARGPRRRPPCRRSRVAATQPAPSLQRRVVGHQLALGAVGGEAHDDHAARLDRGDHALAEGGVDDVVAGREGRATGSAARRRAPSAAQRPAGERLRLGALALDELLRDLGEEARGKLVPRPPNRLRLRA